MTRLESAAKDLSLNKYFSDIGAHKVMGAREEAEAFRRIEALEGEVFAVMASDRSFWRHCLHGLGKAFDGSGKESVAILGAAASVASSSPSTVSLREFVRAVRVTDAGADWMERCYSMSQDKTRSAKREVWSRKVRRAHDEAERAKHAFVAANLRLVVTIVKRYRRGVSDESFGDIIQEGNIGLMRAVDRFDVDRGFKFSTYASWWIRHFVKRGIDDKESLIRTPVHLMETARKVHRTDAVHTAKTGGRMDEDELAEVVGISKEKIRTIMESKSRRVLSIDSPEEETGMTLGDCIPDSDAVMPDDAFATAGLSRDVSALLETLKPFEADIIRWRFGIGGAEEQTLQDIASKHGLSRERIRQIESSALAKLRGLARANEWRAGLSMPEVRPGPLSGK